MAWQEFVTKMTEALAWPVTVVVLALLFRTQLATRLAALKSLKYRDLNLEFETALSKVEAEAGQIGSASDEVEPLATAPPSPRAEIIESWIELERALSDAYDRLDAAEGMMSNALVHRTGVDLARQLHRSGWIDEVALRLVDELRQLRNAAAHEPELALTSDDARRFSRSARRLANLLRDAGPGGPAIPHVSG